MTLNGINALAVKYLMITPAMVFIVYITKTAILPVVCLILVLFAVDAFALLLRRSGSNIVGRSIVMGMFPKMGIKLSLVQDLIDFKMFSSKGWGHDHNAIERVMVDLSKRNDEMSAFNKAKEIIHQTYNINDIAAHIYQIFEQFSNCDRYVFCLFEKESTELLYRHEFGAAAMGHRHCFLREDPVVHGCIMQKKAVIKNQVYIAQREVFGDIAVIPLHISGETTGVIYMETAESNRFSELNTIFFENIASFAAIAVKNAELFSSMLKAKQEIESLYEKTQTTNDELNTYVDALDKTKEELKIKNSELTRYYNEIQTGYLQTVMALANSIEAKDAYTRGHCQRVMEIACEIGKNMGYDENRIEVLRYSAILHDIGKIGTPATIINKIGRLSDEEYNEIKKHPLIAYNILKEVEFIKSGIDAVLQHHERFDGKGYPYGLSGNEISEFGRILCIADAFDAMTSDRPYRKAMKMEDALGEIHRSRGTQFDPAIVDIFIKMSQQIIHSNDPIALS